MQGGAALWARLPSLLLLLLLLLLLHGPCSLVRNEWEEQAGGQERAADRHTLLMHSSRHGSRHSGGVAARHAHSTRTSHQPPSCQQSTPSPGLRCDSGLLRESSGQGGRN